MSLLPQPAAVLQSPSYPPQDLEQGGSIGDGPNLLEPKDPWTPQAPGIDAGCLKNYQYQLAACYAHALKMTKDERRLLVNACYDDFQGAVDAALEAIAATERTLDAATVGIYQPASPLILTLPVAQCRASAYQVGDSVLIDFPVREVGSGRMDVWHSARVIGWADNTRRCGFPYVVNHFVSDENYVSGDLTQEVWEGEDSTAVTIQQFIDHGNTTECDVIFHPPEGWVYGYCENPDLLFYEWTNDHSRSLSHVAINVTQNIGYTAGIIGTPYTIYVFPLPGDGDIGEDPDQWYLDGWYRAAEYPVISEWRLRPSSRVYEEFDSLYNPYGESDYVVNGRFPDGWIIYGYETPTAIGSRDDPPALPGTLTLWNNALVYSPQFLHIQWATYAAAGTIATVDGLAYKYVRTSFGHDGPGG